MARVKPPFASTKKGIAVNLGPDERGLLRTLLGEVRELLTTAPIGVTRSWLDFFHRPISTMTRLKPNTND